MMVSSLQEVPEGMRGFVIPAQKATIFLSDEGAIPQIVIDLWHIIWKLEDAGTLKRAYKADYEVYDQFASDPEHARMRIHIGTKES